MRDIKKVILGSVAALGTIAFAGAADAGRGWHGGHLQGGGGHYFGGHHGHFHGNSGWGPRIGFGWWGPPAYAYYDDWDDCYRVRRYGRWRVVCR